MRSEPTRLQKEKFVKSSRFVVRMEFAVEFTHPVPIAKGREAARKILDGLNPEIRGYVAPVELDEATLKCSELRRLITFRVERGDPEDDDCS